VFRFASGIVVSSETPVDIGDRARPARADARRNLDALLQAAKEVFATTGVEAPVREITERAGVGNATLYRHFPRRADLIAAVFRREIDACADAAPALAAEYAPFEALAHWTRRFADFVATKRGLASALHCGDPAYDGLYAHFEERLRPAFRNLFGAARAAGVIRGDVEAEDLLEAVKNLCMGADVANPGRAQRMVDIFIDGLRSDAGR
jgi:AcrR family transcriptional regulator